MNWESTFVKLAIIAKHVQLASENYLRFSLPNVEPRTLTKEQ
jgi:hypothetical protein